MMSAGKKKKFPIQQPPPPAASKPNLYPTLSSCSSSSSSSTSSAASQQQPGQEKVPMVPPSKPTVTPHSTLSLIKKSAAGFQDGTPFHKMMYQEKHVLETMDKFVLAKSEAADMWDSYMTQESNPAVRDLYRGLTELDRLWVVLHITHKEQMREVRKLFKELMAKEKYIQQLHQQATAAAKKATKCQLQMDEALGKHRNSKGNLDLKKMEHIQKDLEKAITADADIQKNYHEQTINNQIFRYNSIKKMMLALTEAEVSLYQNCWKAAEARHQLARIYLDKASSKVTSESVSQANEQGRPIIQALYRDLGLVSDLPAVPVHPASASSSSPWGGQSASASTPSPWASQNRTQPSAPPTADIEMSESDAFYVAIPENDQPAPRGRQHSHASQQQHPANHNQRHSQPSTSHRQAPPMTSHRHTHPAPPPQTHARPTESEDDLYEFDEFDSDKEAEYEDTAQQPYLDLVIEQPNDSAKHVGSGSKPPVIPRRATPRQPITDDDIYEETDDTPPQRPDRQRQQKNDTDIFGSISSLRLAPRSDVQQQQSPPVSAVEEQEEEYGMAWQAWSGVDNSDDSSSGGSLQGLQGLSRSSTTSSTDEEPRYGAGPGRQSSTGNDHKANLEQILRRNFQVFQQKQVAKEQQGTYVVAPPTPPVSGRPPPLPARASRS